MALQMLAPLMVLVMAVVVIYFAATVRTGRWHDVNGFLARTFAPSPSPSPPVVRSSSPDKPAAIPVVSSPDHTEGSVDSAEIDDEESVEDSTPDEPKPETTPGRIPGSPWAKRTITQFLPKANIVIYATSGLLLLRTGAENVRLYRRIHIAEAHPLGLYRIVGRRRTVLDGPRLVLSYPAKHDADAALAAKKISRNDHRAIVRAEELGVAPPSQTALGGPIFLGGGAGLASAPETTFAIPSTGMEELWRAVDVGSYIMVVHK